MTRQFLAMLMALVLWCGNTGYASAQQATAAILDELRIIFETPESELDLGRVKLTVDGLIDPDVDVDAQLKQIDRMAAEIRSWFPMNAPSTVRLEALKRYLYQSGSWNQYRPYQYDMADLMGLKLENKLVSNYIRTRKGNCISMPILFIILGQRIGLDVTASTAPNHVFVKYRDESGQYYNLETTSGAGFSRDVWIREGFPMTDKAIQNGLYMQVLSKKETAVLISDLLNEYYAKQGWLDNQLPLAELQLTYYPKDISVMLHVCTTYQHLRQQRFVDKYPTPKDIPEEERDAYRELNNNLAYCDKQVRAFGWIPLSRLLKYLAV